MRCRSVGGPHFRLRTCPAHVLLSFLPFRLPAADAPRAALHRTERDRAQGSFSAACAQLASALDRCAAIDRTEALVPDERAALAAELAVLRAGIAPEKSSAASQGPRLSNVPSLGSAIRGRSNMAAQAAWNRSSFSEGGSMADSVPGGLTHRTATALERSPGPVRMSLRQDEPRLWRAASSSAAPLVSMLTDTSVLTEPPTRPMTARCETVVALGRLWTACRGLADAKEVAHDASAGIEDLLDTLSDAQAAAVVRGCVKERHEAEPGLVSSVLAGLGPWEAEEYLWLVLRHGGLTPAEWRGAVGHAAAGVALGTLGAAQWAAVLARCPFVAEAVPPPSPLRTPASASSGRQGALSAGQRSLPAGVRLLGASALPVRSSGARASRRLLQATSTPVVWRQPSTESRARRFPDPHPPLRRFPCRRWACVAASAPFAGARRGLPSLGMGSPSRLPSAPVLRNAGRGTFAATRPALHGTGMKR